MADELVELGFAGVNKFADKYWDPVYGWVDRHRPHRKAKRGAGGKQPGQQQRGMPSGPPPPASEQYDNRSVHEGRHGDRLGREDRYGDRSGREDRYGDRSDREDRYVYDSDRETTRGPRETNRSYAPERRSDDGRRDDRGYGNEGYGRGYEERDYGQGATAQQMAERTREANRYQEALVPRASAPPPGYGYSSQPYGDGRAPRARPTPQRVRSSSWSPPRRSGRRHDPGSRRERSESPDDHSRSIAIVVGALAGGVAGSRVMKGDSIANKAATVGSAIVGGLAGGAVEKMYDHHKDGRHHEAGERGGARGKRREREYNDY